MVVKKFEARSMKEALEMIKKEMGPEAIIVAARDNSKNYGLIGEGSVEITAAIQELNLKKKQLIESKLPPELLEKIHKGSSKAHKELIDKAFAQRESEYGVQNIKNSSTRNQSKTTSQVVKSSLEASSLASLRTQKYIDMMDDVEPDAAPNGVNEKLKIAAQKAWKTIQQSSTPTEVNESSTAMSVIQKDLESIKQIFQNFQPMPQNMIPSTQVSGHPGAEFGLRYELSDDFDKLKQSGLSESLIVEILKSAQEQLLNLKQIKDKSLVRGLVTQVLASKVLISKTTPGTKIEVFIGAGGHGKTTTLVKRASQLSLQEQKRVAIVSTDNHKLGANEQLKIYSQILNIPFMEITSLADWEIVAQEMNDFDSILVDSPGVRFKVTDEMQVLKKLLPPAYLGVNVHLVISATAKDQDALELGKRFSIVGFDDIIFTALDESSQHGVLLNLQNFIGKPFHSFGIGPQIPEDYELATKERVIDLLIGLYSESNLSENILL